MAARHTSVLVVRHVRSAAPLTVRRATRPRVEFFESEFARPGPRRCECHSREAKSVKGELHWTRGRSAEGRQPGPAIILGDSSKSLLIKGAARGYRSEDAAQGSCRLRRSLTWKRG